MKEHEPDKTLSGQESANDETRETRQRIEALRPVLEMLGAGSGFRFRFSETAKTFAFDHEAPVPTFIIGTKFIRERELKPHHCGFGVCHECGHLIQALRDPEGYLRSIQLPKEKARRYPAEQQKAAEQLWHRFYNGAVLDPNDNAIVRSRMPVYQPGSVEEGTISETYREKLFPDAKDGKVPDYRNSALTHQFVDCLLRGAMVPGGEPIVSEGIAEIMQRPLAVYGETMTMPELLQRFIANPQRNVSEILFIAERYLAPVYEELVQKDLAAGRANEPGNDTFDIDGDLDPNVLKDIIRGIQEAQKPGDQKIKDFQNQQARNEMNEAGITEQEDQNRLMEIRELCDPYVRDMKTLWPLFKRLFTTVHMERQAGFKHGTGVDVAEAVRQFGALMNNPSEAEIMYRQVPQVETDVMPKRILLYMVCDLSGSMDQSKRKAVQEVVYTLGQSLLLHEAEERMNTRQQQDKEIAAEVRIVGFGDCGRSTFLPEQQGAEKSADLLKAVVSILHNDLGGTYDDEALEKVRDAALPEMQNIRDGETVVIAVEITDGETQTADKSEALKYELKGLGVATIAIQLPGALYSEDDLAKMKRGERVEEPFKILEPTGTFERVWGADGRRLEQLESLKTTVLWLLQGEIKKQAG